MATRKPTLEEQETTFNLYPKKSGYQCEIYSCTPSDIALIKKYAKEYPNDIIIIREDDISIDAKAPREWFKMKPPTHRKMTEEQKQALRERLAAQRAAN